MEGSGVNVNYGYEGAPASIATASDATLTFTNGGCPANVQPWSTRLMIRGASTSAYNGNFYVANGPTAGECNIAYATAQFEANLTGLTATANIRP